MTSTLNNDPMNPQLLIKGLSPERSERKRQRGGQYVVIGVIMLILGVLVIKPLTASVIGTMATGFLKALIFGAPFFIGGLLAGRGIQAGSMYGSPSLAKRGVVVLVLNLVALLGVGVYIVMYT